MENFNCENHERGYFIGFRITIKTVMYNDKIVVPQKLRRYIVKWYHMYLLHPGLDKNEAMVCQHFY